MDDTMTTERKLTLIVDADDTLWETEVYYEACIAEFGRLMEIEGFRSDEVKAVLAQVERERVPEAGYAPESFVRSLVITYQRLCERHQIPFEAGIADAVREIGQTVIDYPIDLLDGVAETLERLSEEYRLLLLTKGDDAVQRDKLARSGLAHLFEGVHVAHEKDVTIFRELLERYDLHLEWTWMVGNSPRSDINPALEAGIGAIHVPHTKTWDFEQETIVDPERVVVVEEFGALLDVLPSAEVVEDRR
jgi:putative hydrolase of the HAD superfamily